MPVNKFKAGDIAPVKRRWFNNEPPYKQEYITVGVEGSNYTILKCWVRRPNQTYPMAKVFISMSNGMSSTFSRLASVEELDTISKWLKTILPGIKSALAELEPEAQAALAQKEQFEKMRQTAEFLRESGATFDPNTGEVIAPEGDVIEG
jgi:hypothetical protein